MQQCDWSEKCSTKPVAGIDYILALSCFQLASPCSNVAFTVRFSNSVAGYLCYWEQADNLEAAGVPFVDGFARDSCAMGSRLSNGHVSQWLGTNFRSNSR